MPSSPQTGGARRWALVLLAINLVYLAIELSFNARLLDVAAAAVGADGIHGLEFYGRTISGIGATLLAWRALGYDPARRRRSLALLAAAAVVCVPTVFHLQKAVIEALVDGASPETRRTALYLSVLRDAMSDGAVQLDGMRSDGDARTFIATLGALLYHVPTAVGVVDGNLEAIAQRVALRRVDPDGAWRRYKEADAAADRAFRAYEEASAALGKLVGDAEGEAARAWDALQKDLDDGWRKLDAARPKASDLQAKVALGAYDKLVVLFNQLADCGANEACRAPVLARYRADVSREIGVDVPLDWWCVGWDGTGVNPRPHQSAAAACPHGVPQVGQVILYAKGLEFERQSGYPFNINHAEFLAHPKTLERVRAMLAERGIAPPAGWTPADRGWFARAAAERVRGEAERRFREGVEKEFGTAVRPGLARDALWSDAAVRRALLAKTNVPAEQAEAFERVGPGAGRPAFERAVLLPPVQKAVGELVGKVRGPAERLANGAPEEALGEDAVRAMIVPPVALAFSLFFALTNAVAVAVSAAGLAVPALAARLRWAPALGAVAIVLLPFLTAPPMGSSPTYHAILDRVYAADRTVGGAMDWLNRMQPLVHPVGDAVRRTALMGFRFGSDQRI